MKLNSSDVITFIFGGLPGVAAKRAPDIGNWTARKLEERKEKRAEKRENKKKGK